MFFNRSCCGRSRKQNRRVRLRHSALHVTVRLLASVHPPVCPRPPLGPVGHWHAQGMRQPQHLARRLRCESLPRGLGQWRCPRLKLKQVPGSALLCLWDAAPTPLHTPPPRAPGLIRESQGYVLPTHISAVRFTQDLWRGFGSWKTKTKRVSECEWENGRGRRSHVTLNNQPTKGPPPPHSLLCLPTHSDIFQPLAHTDKFVKVILTFQLSSYTIIVSQSEPQPNPTSPAPPRQAVLRCGHNRLPNASVPVCFTFMLSSRESVLRARLFS